MRLVRWLYPGIGVKRWLLVFTAGIILLGVGIAMAIDPGALIAIETAITTIASSRQQVSTVRAGMLVTVAGGALTLVALQAIVRNVYQAAVPRGGESLGKLLFSRRNLERGPRIVAIGGGTGLSALLRGLKELTGNLAAVVTVSDDGGSSGRLRNELGILPPGDIRNCLLALADTEPLMEKLFQYRFREGTGLAGHNFGNLFIAALTGVTGDFEEAVRESSKVLAVRGKVLPTTLQNVTLSAELTDGRHVRGETAISSSTSRVKKLYLDPPDPEPLPEALAAIRDADAIVLGPGSLYTSVITNLLVPGVAQAIRDSRALKIHVLNIMTQPGETPGYRASDHVLALFRHTGQECLEVLVANSQQVPEDVALRYAAQGAVPVEVDEHRLANLGVTLVREQLASWDGGIVRHSPEKLARCLWRIILKHRGAVIRQRLIDMYTSPEKAKG
jgi:uncharacterized cofD-like protein